MNDLHRAWHWFWAVVWSQLHWYSRGAAHLDRWLVLGLDDLSLHVLYPNDVRVGCELVSVESPSPAAAPDREGSNLENRTQHGA